MKPHVFHVARECSEIVSSGGLGDVVLQLAARCAAEGFPTTVILPRYGGMSREFQDRTEPVPDPVAIPMSYGPDPSRTEPVVFRTMGHRGFEVCLVDSPRFRGKLHPYVYDEEEAAAFQALPREERLFCGAERPFPGFEVRAGTGHFDYFAMNLLLQKAALAYVRLRAPERAVIHGHDAHAAVLPLLALGRPWRDPTDRPRTIVTSHNFGEQYRQRCGDRGFVHSVTGCDAASVDRCWVDGAFDPFAAAALYADRLTTVSDGYAWEVLQAASGQCPPDYGGDLRGFSRFLSAGGRDLLGITNGIDPALKGPEALPPALKPERSEAGAFLWKKAAKTRLLSRIRQNVPAWGIARERILGGLDGMRDLDCLFTSVGRLVEQKAPDVMAQAAAEVLSYHGNAGLAVLGDSDNARIVKGLESLARRFPGRVVVIRGFSDLLSREIYAGGDFLLVPSRCEPCGLVDLIAQINGNIPIANQVGGLAKVVDGGTGIGYFALSDRENLRGLVSGMHRAMTLFAGHEELREMRERADRHVRSRYSWEAVFPKYRSLYED